MDLPVTIANPNLHEQRRRWNRIAHRYRHGSLVVKYTELKGCRAVQAGFEFVEYIREEGGASGSYWAMWRGDEDMERWRDGKMTETRGSLYMVH